jgi:hypothetical protein
MLLSAKWAAPAFGGDVSAFAALIRLDRHSERIKLNLVESAICPPISGISSIPDSHRSDTTESHLKLRSISMEESMRSTLLALALGTTLVVSGDAVVFAQSISGASTGVPIAPIGHLQPRALQFSSHSAAERAEQQKMSQFDAEQQMLDGELDKQLNICRC